MLVLEDQGGPAGCIAASKGDYIVVGVVYVLSTSELS